MSDFLLLLILDAYSIAMQYIICCEWNRNCSKDRNLSLSLSQSHCENDGGNFKRNYTVRLATGVGLSSVGLRSHMTL